MGKGKQAAIGVAAALACAVAAAGNAAAQQAGVEYNDTFTTRAPGAATGRNFSAKIFATSDPDAKPPPLTHVRYEMPEGARFDPDAVPQCAATDAELIAEGSSACEPATRLGVGEVFLDSGFPEPNRMMIDDFTVMNGRGGTIIALAQDRNSGARVALHA